VAAVSAGEASEAPLVDHGVVDQALLVGVVHTLAHHTAQLSDDSLLSVSDLRPRQR